MKRLVLSIIAIFAVVTSFAEDSKPESVGPTYGITVERYVSLATGDCGYLEDVYVTLKAAHIVDGICAGVKVVIKDKWKKDVIYKKRFISSRLYAYSNGQLQVGKGNALTNIIISKSKYSGKWYMELKENGIY